VGVFLSSLNCDNGRNTELYNPDTTARLRSAELQVLEIMADREAFLAVTE